MSFVQLVRYIENEQTEDDNCDDQLANKYVIVVILVFELPKLVIWLQQITGLKVIGERLRDRWLQNVDYWLLVDVDQVLVLDFQLVDCEVFHGGVSILHLGVDDV